MWGFRSATPLRRSSRFLPQARPPFLFCLVSFWSVALRVNLSSVRARISPCRFLPKTGHRLAPCWARGGRRVNICRADRWMCVGPGGGSPDAPRVGRSPKRQDLLRLGRTPPLGLQAKPHRWRLLQGRAWGRGRHPSVIDPNSSQKSLCACLLSLFLSFQHK